MHSAPEFILLPRCIHFAIAAFSEDASFPLLHEALKQVYLPFQVHPQSGYACLYRRRVAAWQCLMRPDEWRLRGDQP
jgi:hypothetical protein